MTGTQPHRDPTTGVALVAGGSRGLGLLIARELGRTGRPVVICGRDAATLDRAAEWLRADGVEVTSTVCDVRDPVAVQALVDGTERDGRPVEVMICVAGIIQVGPLDDLHRGHFEEAIDTMLWGPVNTALAVVGPMRARGHGRIGVVTSIGGLVPPPHLLPYSAAKFGAVGFSRGLRTELAGSGVSVTTVIPGLMRTGSHLHARFVGDHPREYAWFAALASLPVLSIDAERAARRVVRGVLRGRTQVLLTPAPALASVMAGVAPRLTSAALGLSAKLLPRPTGDSEAVPGHRAEDGLSPRAREVIDRLTALGRRAAERFNQLPR